MRYAECPKCKRVVSVNRYGAIRAHGYTTRGFIEHHMPPCTGSGSIVGDEKHGCQFCDDTAVVRMHTESLTSRRKFKTLYLCDICRKLLVNYLGDEWKDE